MATENVTINIDSKADLKGFKQAETAAAKLNKTVKGLALTLGVGYGARAVAAFGKASLKAFAEDEAAANRLANAVKNLGLEFANPYIADYISNLEKTSQVADDVLRPAFQRLLQQTGSIAKSQSILNTAIEVSRGTSKDLASVSEDLAKAYYGNFKSLRKYSLGLTDAELKAKSFSEIQDILNKKFKGSNAAYLNTYAGQLGVLSLAWNNLQENAGKALFTLAGANGDQSSGARRLGGLIDAFGTGLVEAAKLLNNAATAFGQAYFGVGSPKPEAIPAPTPGKELFRKSSSNDAALKKAEAQQAKLYKQQIAAQKAIQNEQKKQAALKKASAVFDMEQIQRIAALKGELSEEDKKRVQLQLALLNDNEALATKLTKEILTAQDATGNLYKYFQQIPDAKNPFGYLDKWIVEFQSKLNALQFPNATGAAVAVSTASLPPISQEDINRILEPSSDRGISTVRDYFSGIGATATNALTSADIGRLAKPMSSGSSTIGDYLSVVVQIDGKEIAAAVQNQALNGNSSTINRAAGNFG